MINNIPILYSDKKECCGCSACVSICPKNAISMVLDNEGFLYPEIDVNLCIGCQMCRAVCSFQNKPESVNI